MDSKEKNKSEKIIYYVAGIMSALGGSKILRSSEFLGVGKVYTPENTMVITNRRIVFLVIPMPGGNKTISGIDIPMWQFILARDEIEKKSKEILSSKPLDEIINSNQKNFFVNLSEIKKVKFGFFTSTIKIYLKNGKSLKYSLRSKEDFKNVKKILKNFVS